MKNVKVPKRVYIKASPNKNLTQKIDIATQTLERNIGFINSCDTNINKTTPKDKSLLFISILLLPIPTIKLYRCPE